MVFSIIFLFEICLIPIFPIDIDFLYKNCWNKSSKLITSVIGDNIFKKLKIKQPKKNYNLWMKFNIFLAHHNTLKWATQTCPGKSFLSGDTWPYGRGGKIILNLCLSHLKNVVICSNHEYDFVFEKKSLLIPWTGGLKISMIFLFTIIHKKMYSQNLDFWLIFKIDWYIRINNMKKNIFKKIYLTWHRTSLKMSLFCYIL